MTKLEIIKETVEYYKNNNRGISNNGNCVYLSQNGDMCAVGRCLENPEDIGIKPKDIETKTIDADFLIADYGDGIFKKQYQGHDPRFWQKLQNFHDTNRFWVSYKTKKGNKLTDDGKNHLKFLLKKYESN
jgi:hypothetical protein